MTVFFTSDLHLGHARINELAERPFGSVEEADAELVHRWNERVTPRDDVLVLGDICLGRLVDSLALAATLNGRKHLVPGNHDRVSYLYRASPAKKVEWRDAYECAGFHVMASWVESYPLGGTADEVGFDVDLCHFPYTGDSHGDDRFLSARPQDQGQWLLHGHTHQKERLSGPRQVHVGVDAWDYAPVSEAEVVELIRANS